MTYLFDDLPIAEPDLFYITVPSDYGKESFLMFMEKTGFKEIKKKQSSTKTHDSHCFKAPKLTHEKLKEINSFLSQKKAKSAKPYSMYEYFTGRMKEKYPNRILPVKPSTKDLANWKNIIGKYEEDNCKKLIDYGVENFEQLRKDFKISSLSSSVFLGFSDSIFTHMDSSSISRNNRALSDDDYK